MNHLVRSKCVHPDFLTCLPDELMIHQLDDPDGTFRRSPRVNMPEFGVSVMFGDLTVAEVARLVSPRIDAEGRRTRTTTVGALRAAGFVVLHTPGKVASRPHASIVWPGRNGPMQPDKPWDEGVQGRFDSCFDVRQRDKMYGGKQVETP